MKIPSLKRRKPIVYISLTMYILLIAFIIVEASIGSSASGQHSGLIAQITAWFVNLVNGPQISEVIKPTGFGNITDSSYLGEGQIAIGSTTLLSLEVQYPSKKTNDVYDRSYVVEALEGDSNDYSIVRNSYESSGKYYVDVRIVANKLTDDDYKIRVKVADSDATTYDYSFNIVDRAAPVNYEQRFDSTIPLKQGETRQIELKLKPKDGDNIISHDDHYLKRVYDYTKLNSSSSNENVATIDKYGVVHAHNEGSATITYGNESYNITVSNQNIVKPSTNSIVLTTSGSASYLDYDYVFSGTAIERDEYSMLVYPNFTDTTLEDQSVTYELDDNFTAMLAPYKYDENGYPIYKDDNGNDCVRVCGYRKKGNVNLTCYSNNDSSIKKTLSIEIGEALPTSMNVNISGSKTVYVNSQTNIKGTFNPKNTSSTSITVTCDKPELVELVGNGTQQVTIKAKSTGTVHFTVTSVANPSLIKEFNLIIEYKEAINNDNYTEFHQFMRKFAGHFFLFLITAVFGAIFFFTYFEDFLKLYIYVPITLFLGFAVAGISELIQYYIPSRSGAWMDVGIDFLGYFVGTLLVGVFFLIKYLIKKKKSK